MDFIEDDYRPVTLTEEKHRVAYHVFGRRQVAIHVKTAFRSQALGQRGLTRAAHAREPDDRHLPPRQIQPFLPKGSRNHGSILSK